MTVWVEALRTIAIHIQTFNSPVFPPQAAYESPHPPCKALPCSAPGIDDFPTLRSLSPISPRRPNAPNIPGPPRRSEPHVDNHHAAQLCRRRVADPVIDIEALHACQKS